MIRRFIILALLFGYGCFVYAQQQAGVTITYFHNNATGTPVAASDEQGEVIWRKTYRPYGSELDNGGWPAQNNTIGYTGHRLDSDTGLVDMGARLYDPIIGRFLSMDPALVDPGNLHTFNRYAYANNNPYKYIDPNGEASLLVNAFRRGFGHQDALQISGVSNTTMMVVGAAAGGTTVGAGAVATLGPVTALKEGVQMAFEQATGISVPVPSLRNMGKFFVKRAKPKLGSMGGDGAKKPFSNKVKDQARVESNDTCVFCDTKTTREPGPTRSEIDHGIPKSRGGNNSLDNAQNTCRNCNRKKGTKTTDEFLNQ